MRPESASFYELQLTDKKLLQMGKFSSYMMKAINLIAGTSQQHQAFNYIRGKPLRIGNQRGQIRQAMPFIQIYDLNHYHNRGMRIICGMWYASNSKKEFHHNKYYKLFSSLYMQNMSEDEQRNNQVFYKRMSNVIDNPTPPLLNSTVLADPQQIK